MALACSLIATLAAQEPTDLFAPPLPAPVDGRIWVPRHGGAAELRRRMPAIGAAIDHGLRWLVAQQAEDGHWGSAADEASAGTVFSTAVVLLPLLTQGSTPATGEDMKVVRRGVQWLVQHQTASGLILGPDEAAPERGHAVATVVLVEAATLAPYPKLVADADRAVRALLEQCDSSAWSLLALTIAKQSPELFPSARRRPAGTSASVEPGSLSLLTAYLGCGGKEPNVPEAWVRTALREVQGNDAERRSCAAAGLYQVGSAPWEAGERRVYHLIRTQDPDGSWPPPTLQESRLLETAFTVLTVQTACRYGRSVHTTRHWVLPAMQDPTDDSLGAGSGRNPLRLRPPTPFDAFRVSAAASVETRQADRR